MTPSSEPSDAAIRIAPVREPQELSALLEVYRRAFQYSEVGLNVRLLTAIQRNGGIVLGAWVGGRPAGFVFGFVAHAPGIGYYHYSQVAAVDAAFRGRGIGRLLKLAQREHVLAQGITRMRWYFDPMRSRNAHFNLNVLGADAVGLERNLYGPGAGRDAGLPTHRLIAEWTLDGPPPESGEAPADALRIDVPAEWDALRAGRPQEARAALERVAASFDAAFRRGLRAVALERGAETARYLLRERR